MDEIDDIHVPKIMEGFERLKKTEPVAYITQRAFFYSREFYVDARVLVPRIDTEVLVDKVLEYSQ
jgi:release factor glutamine methyltransferase